MSPGNGVVRARRWDDAGWLLVGCAVVALVILSVHQLSTKPFWSDEAVSLTMARLPADEFAAKSIGYEANGALYYVVLSFWRLLGEGEARIRLLSVLCAAATLPLLYLVGRRHVGVTAAALGCALFAVNPFVIEYAQEARMYAMAILLTTASVLAWSLATETDRLRWWAAYAVLGVAALFTHFFAGLVVLGLGITWLSGAVPRSWAGLAGQAVILIAGLPLVVFVAESSFAQVWWIRPFSEAGVSAVLGAVGAGSLTLSVVLYVLALVAIPTRDVTRLRRLAPLIAWWLTPVVAGIAISVYKSLLEGRYFIVALPPLLLLAAAGAVRVGTAMAGRRGRIAAATATLFMVAILAIGPLTTLYGVKRWDWRGAAGWVSRTAEAGDRITYVPERGRIPFLIYLERAGGSAAVEATVDQVRAAPGRTWLVLYLLRSTDYEGLDQTFPGYRVVESKLFDGVRVQLIERS